jgi:drug/metabolite transporter (DMT)-like permease
MAFFLLNERLSAIQIGGSVMILAAVLFLRLYEGRLAND